MLSSPSHDRGVNTFSREGRIFQIEYATKAAALSSTSIGLVFKDGIILAIDKKASSPLMIPGSSDKLVEIDHHCVCAVAGLIADSKLLVAHARSEAQTHIWAYGEPIPIQALAESICDLLISFGEDGDHSRARPFGVALLLAGIDMSKNEPRPMLFHLDPAGTYSLSSAYAIGAGSETSQNRLCADWKPDMTYDEGITLVLTTLKEVMESKISSKNVDVCVVRIAKPEGDKEQTAKSHVGAEVPHGTEQGTRARIEGVQEVRTESVPESVTETQGEKRRHQPIQQGGEEGWSLIKPEIIMVEEAELKRRIDAL